MPIELLVHLPKLVHLHAFDLGKSTFFRKVKYYKPNLKYIFILNIIKVMNYGI